MDLSSSLDHFGEAYRRSNSGSSARWHTVLGALNVTAVFWAVRAHGAMHDRQLPSFFFQSNV